MVVSRSFPATPAFMRAFVVYWTADGIVKGDEELDDRWRREGRYRATALRPAAAALLERVLSVKVRGVRGMGIMADASWTGWFFLMPSPPSSRPSQPS
jgi:hypothetical protein